MELYLRYLENTFFDRDSNENQGVKKFMFLYDFHDQDCSSKYVYRQDTNAFLVYFPLNHFKRLLLILLF